MTRRVQTNVDESQTNVDEGKQVTKRVQTNVDESKSFDFKISKNFEFRRSDTWSNFVVVVIMQQ